MEKSLKIISQAKQDGETVQYYIRDLNTWEIEMKKKEAALKDEQAEQVLPPVRTRQRRDKKKSIRKRSADSDQPSEESDLTKPHEEMEDVASLTPDPKQSETVKQAQLREEAQHQKERGNKFVSAERWDEAIACYNRAIQLVKNDAIYYANRGLCYLKKDSLHQAEQDCTEALRLDPTYVKALQRRATARERLGSLRAATADLTEVLRLEPNNTAARKQLESIRIRMGTKGRKAKSSPVNKTSPSTDSSFFTPELDYLDDSKDKRLPRNPEAPLAKIQGVPRASQIDLDMKATPILKVDSRGDASNIDNWKDGVGENVLVIKPVKKPPHLRSKRALKTIPIREIPLGKTIEDLENSVKPATRMKIIEIDNSQGDTNNNDKEIENTTTEEPTNTTIKKTVEIVDNTPNNNVINEVKNEVKNKVKSEVKADLNENVKIETSVKSKIDMVAPTNSVQFMTEWRNLRGDDSARCDYLSLLDPYNIPNVFANALESSVLSEIIQVLYTNKSTLCPRVTHFLKGLARVRRLSALVMFLAGSDKELLNKLVVHCKTVEGASEEDITEIKNKYEL